MATKILTLREIESLQAAVHEAALVPHSALHCYDEALAMRFSDGLCLADGAPALTAARLRDVIETGVPL